MGYDFSVSQRDHERLDWAIPWAFPDSDETQVIDTSQWVIESGPQITVDTPTIALDRKSTRAFFSGTRPHGKTVVANVVTTTAGRVYERRIQVLGI